MTQDKMNTTDYRVDSRLIVPVVVAGAAGIVLIALEGLSHRGLVLSFVLAPFFYLGAEILSRRIRVDPNGITIAKFLRSVRFNWADVRHVDAATAGNKVFIILHRDHGLPTFITNTVGSFKELVGRIHDVVPREKLTEAAQEVLADPPVKHGPMIQAWLACVVLTGLVIARLMQWG